LAAPYIHIGRAALSVKRKKGGLGIGNVYSPLDIDDIRPEGDFLGRRGSVEVFEDAKPRRLSFDSPCCISKRLERVAYPIAGYARVLRSDKMVIGSVTNSCDADGGMNSKVSPHVFSSELVQQFE